MTLLLKRTIVAAALCCICAVSIPAQEEAPAGSGSTTQGGRRGRGVRGTVVSVSGSNVSLKTESGESWVVIATENTRVNLDRQPVKLASLKAGDEVMAMGVPDQDKHELHALAILGASAAAVAKLKADLGKTYIVGRITAIHEVQLTVLRPDKVKQTITLDESTSLHRGGRLPAEYAGMGFGGGFGGGGARRPRQQAGEPPAGPPEGESEGESITLADVKVGDNLAATGSLKDGTFVPLDLHVTTPRPRQAGAPAE